MMCILMGGVSSLFAQEVTIGEGTGTTNAQYFPIYIGNSGKYAISQQIYFASEIKMQGGGTITEISFYTYNNKHTRNIEIYMANTTKETFSSNADWVTSATKVFEGDVVFGSGNSESAWIKITLDSIFEYNGTSNLMLCVNDITGSATGDNNYPRCNTFSGGANTAKYKTGTHITDLSSLSTYTATGKGTRNIIKLKFGGGEPETPTAPTAPTAPTLKSPTNGEPDIFNPSLNFSLGDNTTHYQVLIAEANGTGTPIGDYKTLIDWTEKTSTVSYQTSHLKPNTTYSWKVVARNGEGEDAPTTESSASFTTRDITSAPGAITNVSPANEAQNLENPILSWKFGANTEEFQLWFGQDPNDLEKKSTGDWENTKNLTEIYTYTPSNLSSGTYYWRVDTRNTAGQDSYNTTNGELYSFTVASIPDDIIPIYPTDGATGISNNTTISWTFSSNTKQYRVLYYLTKYQSYDYMTGWLDVDQETFIGSIETSSWGISAGQTVKWCVEVINSIGGREMYNSGTKKTEPKEFTYTTASISPAILPSPANGARLEGTEVQLKWQYNSDVTQYQVLYDTDSENLGVKQDDWTAAEGTGGAFTLSDLILNTKYYWQVNVKNGEEIAEGEIWSFVSLKKPSFVNNVINVYPGSNIETSADIQLNGIPYSIGADSYNIYVDGSLLEENLASDSYTLNGINYNGGNPYVVKATAVYEGLGESLGSEPVNVYVSGYASVAGTITGVSGAIEGATIQYVGKTILEADVEKTFTFTTDAKGQFSGNIPCGTYTTTVSAEKYNNATREGKNFGVASFDSENVTLTPIIPDNVTPISPADSATNVTSKIIKFQFAEGTTGYRFLYGEAEDQLAYCGYGTKDEWLETNSATEMEIEAPYFSPGTTYYWAVDVRNELGQRSVHEGGEDIAIYSFTTSSVAAATYNSPVNGAILDQTSATLNWKYNHNGDAQYQVLAGTDSEYLEVKQDWTAAEGTGGAFTLSDLNLNTKYYWQVNVKNNEGTAEGEIWWFASLENPTMTNESNIYSVNKVEITWNEIAEASSYNVYSKENETEILLDNVSEGRYEFSPNQDTYTFVVKAVYDGIGESTGSTSTINISKFVDVECNVTNNLNNNQVVENATIKFIGITTLGDAFEQTFTTDSNGTFSDNIPCGVYDIKVSANRFDNDSLTDLDLASGKTYTYSIKLEPELPGNVTPISPADSATNVNNPTIVSWEFAKNTTQYRVLISDDTTNFRYVNGGEWLDVENEECSFPTDNLGLITGQQVWWCVDVKNDLNAVRSFWNSENKPALYNFTLSDQVSVNCTSPTQNEVLNNTDVTLQWNYGKGNNVTHYKVSLWDCNGTELLNQGWTERATDGTGLVANGNYTVSLDPTMKYTWRVDVKKNEDGEVIEGKLMSFITPLEVPSISTEDHNIYTANTNIEWNNTGNHVNGYNIYLNDILYNNELTKTNSYEVTDLTRNIEEGHKIQVTAIYKFGDGNNYESNKSEAITVKVIGYANISGSVKNTNDNGIEGATIKFTGTDAFEKEQEISTESDENGAYEINIPEGTYVRTVEKEGYFNDTIKSKEYAASNITNDITLVSSAIFTVDVNASINDIDIRLSNNNWPDDANFSGSYNIYYKEDNDEDATGPLNNYFAKEPYSTTLLLADKAEFRTIWTTLPNGTYKIGVQQGSNEINWCTESIVRNYSVIGTDGSWNEGSNWTDGKVADENAVVSVTAHITIDSDINVKSISISRNNASLTIKKGCTLTAEEVINEGSPSNLKLEDGAQLRQGNSELNGQFIMNVVTPTIWAQNNVTGWQFISMPFTDAKISTFTNNANNEGGRYDLYRFDGRVKDEEWINQKDTTNNFETEFRLGYGYLASSEFAETFVSNGNFSTYSGKEFVYKLDTISGESNYSRFYLLGNPFSFDMNWDDVQHTGIVDGYATVNKYGTYNYHAGGTIPVGDGFFVKAEGNTIIPSISYNENVRSRAKAESLNITVGNKDGEDNVVLSFAGTDKEGFPKLDNFNDRIANIFVLDNDIRYGIFNYDRDVEEIELAFIASEMGKYTISIEADGKFEAITLVDRFTGIETNMMFEDYTFTATSLQDYNRFIVRLSMNKGDVQEDEHFVYQSGEDLIIDAEGLVQIIDVMGRVVYSSDINGKSRVDVSNFKDASYVIRVVNEKEVKTQKVVIF